MLAGTATAGAPPMIIAQISDLHVDAPGRRGVGDTDSIAALHRAVAHVNALDPAPDLVLATGDLAATKGSADEYAVLREGLAALRAPVYLIPGNHDSRDGLRAAFPDHGYLPAAGFLHYAIEDRPLRLIGLDTTVPGENGGLICAERRAWLADRLAEARDRPTLIFMHHPPFPIGIAAMDAMNCRGGDALAAVVERNPQVERVVCGHVHRPVVRRWAGTVAATAPSALVQLDLALGDREAVTWIHEPPACLVHIWEPALGLATHLSVIGAFRRAPVRNG